MMQARAGERQTLIAIESDTDQLVADQQGERTGPHGAVGWWSRIRIRGKHVSSISRQLGLRQQREPHRSVEAGKEAFGSELGECLIDQRCDVRGCSVEYFCEFGAHLGDRGRTVTAQPHSSSNGIETVQHSMFRVEQHDLAIEDGGIHTALSGGLIIRAELRASR